MEINKAESSLRKTQIIEFFAENLNEVKSSSLTQLFFQKFRKIGQSAIRKFHMDKLMNKNFLINLAYSCIVDKLALFQQC